jgi:glutathione S-transferase
MKIHGDVISPFTRMCLVTAHEVGLKDKVRLVPAHVKPFEVNEKLAGLSPIGRIPVLETDHGHPIYDSRVIMEYLAHHAGAADFIPDEGVKRFKVLTLLALSQGVAEAAVALRYEMAIRPEEKRWPEFKVRLKQRIEMSLDEVEAQWIETLTDLSAASVALACVLGYVDFRHDYLQWRASRPNLAAFEKRFSKRMSMDAWPLTPA